MHRAVDIRISTIPTIYGEKVVMRLLDKTNLKTDLEDLGFDRGSLDIIHKAIAQPHGMILLTGPTGSGKTTTLYSALTKINSPDKNIMTVEDPVEYELAGINQVSARPTIGLDFAAALRSFLRQDPDVILVGRDPRLRDRVDRHQGRTDGAPRVQHAAHEQRHLVGGQAAQHGSGALSHLHVAEPGHRAAAGPQDLHELQGGVRA